MENKIHFLIVKILGFAFLIGMVGIFINYSRNIRFEVEVENKVVSSSNQTGKMKFYMGRPNTIRGVTYEYKTFSSLKDGAGTEAIVTYIDPYEYKNLMQYYKSIKECPSEVLEPKLQSVHIISDNSRLTKKTHFKQEKEFEINGYVLVFAGGTYRQEHFSESHYPGNSRFFFIQDTNTAREQQL